MAKIFGPFEISGSTGDSAFCRTENGNIMKMKGGATPWQVEHWASMEGTRRVNREFKRATDAATLMRRALVTQMDAVKNGKLCGRMNGLMLKVIETDTVSDLGERKVSLGDLSLMAGFEFSHKLELEDAIPLNLSDCYSIEAGKVVLKMPAVRIRRKKVLPKAATHYRLVSGMMSIDFEKKKYSFTTKRSDLYAIGRQAGGAFGVEHLATDGYEQGYLWLVGIEFYKLVNDKPVLVKGGAMRVMEWIGQDAGRVVEEPGVGVDEQDRNREVPAVVVAMEKPAVAAVYEVPAAAVLMEAPTIAAGMEAPAAETSTGVPAVAAVTDLDGVETWERVLADAERVDAYAEAIWESAFAGVEVEEQVEVAAIEMRAEVVTKVAGALVARGAKFVANAVRKELKDEIILAEELIDIVDHEKADESCSTVTVWELSPRTEASVGTRLTKKWKGDKVDKDGILL